MAWVCLIIGLIHKPLNRLFNCLFSCWEIGDIDPNEDIENYWKTLDMNDLGWCYMEECKVRDLFKKYANGPQPVKF